MSPSAQRRQRNILFYLIVVTILSFISKARASEYYHESKLITRGQAIMVLAANPDAIVTKVDRMTLDRTKGTLKILKTVKK